MTKHSGAGVLIDGALIPVSDITWTMRVDHGEQSVVEIKTDCELRSAGLIVVDPAWLDEIFDAYTDYTNEGEAT